MQNREVSSIFLETAERGSYICLTVNYAECATSPRKVRTFGALLSALQTLSSLTLEPHMRLFKKKKTQLSKLACN
jgi:hypothetical protein